MPLWIWLCTFLKGFLPVDGKRIGKLLWVTAICLGVLITYNKFTAPTTKTQIRYAEKVTIEAPNGETFFLGIKIFKLKLGISMK